MIRAAKYRRGIMLRLLCTTALLAGLVTPGTAWAADDGSFASAPVLTPVQQAGTLNIVGDRFDRFRVDLAADDVLTLDLSGLPAYQDFDLSLYSPGVAAPEVVDREEFYLVTRSNAPSTAEEHLSYLVPPGGSGTYYIEISAQAGAVGSYRLDWTLSPAAGDATRLFGADRYATSCAASRSSFTTSSAVVIASGANFPDALAAAGLAGALDCPVLLAPPATSADDQRLLPLFAEISRLEASDAYVIGGTAAVGELVYTKIGERVTTAQRIPGATRYETARNVADMIDEIKGSPSESVFLVRGDSFADALAVSPFAYSQAMPILLTPPRALDAYTRSYLELNDVGQVLIAGGLDAVSASVAASVDGLNGGSTTVERMSGLTRYETAAEVANDCVGFGWGDWTDIGIATGRNFPDALSAGAALGVRGGVLLLTDGSVLSAPAEESISGRAVPATKVLVLGGSAAVSDSVINSIRGLLP